MKTSKEPQRAWLYARVPGNYIETKNTLNVLMLQAQRDGAEVVGWGYTVPKKISADRKNAETRRQTPDPMLTRGKTMEDIDPRPSFKTVAAQLRKAAARSAERAVNATRKEER